MTTTFTINGWEEFSYWIENDPSQVLKINALIKSIQTTPFKGLGKPEPLKHQLKGYWSRRINHQHGLVYRITGKKRVDQQCIIFQCRFHFD